MKRNSESGYALLVILLMVTLLAIALAAAVPAIKTQIRREQEIELQHRANEYVKAIQKYYHKFGRYPASIEQLESTNNLRFLRRRYKDPITGKDDWKIIHLGEAKYPPKLKTNSLGRGQVGQQIGQNIGTNPGQDIGTSPGGLGSTGQLAQQSPQPIGGVGYTGAGQTAGSTLGGTAGAGPNAALGGTGGGLGQVGQSGQPMIGVLAPVNKESIRVFNERHKYNEWEFIYDPRLEAAQNAGAAVGGAPQAGPGNGIGGTGANTPFNAPTSSPQQNNFPR